jgi:hypothetical protein
MTTIQVKGQAASRGEYLDYILNGTATALVVILFLTIGLDAASAPLIRSIIRLAAGR